jgi:hypothetical protein
LIYSSLGEVRVVRLPTANRARILTGQPITSLPIDDEMAHHPSIDVPHFFREALRFYEFSNASTPPLFLGHDIEIYFPPNLDSNFPIYYTLDTLFSLLSIDDIVTLIGAIFLDATVVVIGSSLKDVSHTIIALEFLLQPCQYSGSIVPILPSDPTFLTLLDSPTPFIVGVAPSPELRRLTFLDTSIFVNLDRKVLSNSGFPEFPNHREIVQRIAAILDKEKSKVPHPFGYPLVFRKCEDHRFSFSPTTVDRIAEVIREPLGQLLSDFVFCFFVTDMSSAADGGRITVFNAELFLAQVGEREKGFFMAFIESQTFQLYIEDKIAEYLVKKGAAGRIGVLQAGIGQPEGGWTRKRTKSIDHIMLEVL